MKRCPECNRTYAAETITFCLADGSLLSAPYDPQATQHLPTHSVDTSPTEVMDAASKPAALPPTQRAREVAPLQSTIASSISPNIQKQELTPALPAVRKSNRLPWIIGSLVALIIFSVALIKIISRNSKPSGMNCSEVNTANQNQREQARTKAECILSQARAGEDFAALAHQYSEDEHGSKGGDLYVFGPGDRVKPFEDAAYALQPGQISDIVETDWGYYIIKVEKRIKVLPQEGGELISARHILLRHKD